MSVVLNRDRIEEAYAAFKRTCGQEVTDVDNDIRAQFNFMHSQLLYEKQHAVSFKGLLTNPHYRKRCLLGWVMLFAAQGTGTQVINSTWRLSTYSQFTSNLRTVVRLWPHDLRLARFRHIPATLVWSWMDHHGSTRKYSNFLGCR